MKAVKSSQPSTVALRVFQLLMIATPSTIFFCLLRVATKGGVPYLSFILWQSVAAGLLLGVVLCVRRTRVPMGGAHLRYYAASALFGLAIPYVAMTLASPNIPVGVLSMTLTIEPAITYLLALVLLLERYHPLRFTGLVIGVFGLALIVLPQASLPAREMLSWVLVGLAVPVSWAIWSNWMAYDRLPEVDSVVAAFAMLLIGALVLFPVVVFSGQLWWFDEDRAHLWWLVPVFGLLNVWLWLASFEVIRIAGPVFYSTWTFVGTPMVIVSGILFFAERHSWWIWAALMLLLVSLYLVNATMHSVRNRQVNEVV